jgi:holo-[acyl-carrier protein] synthase
MKQSNQTYAINEGGSFQCCDLNQGTVKSVLGIGTDIVDIDRVQRGLTDQTGLEAQLFTDGEQRFCRSTARPTGQMAALFAAKEAFLKAIGVGLRQGTRFREIEIMVDAYGQPYFRLHGGINELTIAQNIRTAQLSLAFDEEVAVAFVVLGS